MHMHESLFNHWVCGGFLKLFRLLSEANERLLGVCSRAAGGYTTLGAGLEYVSMPAQPQRLIGPVKESNLDFIHRDCSAKALVKPMASRDSHWCTKSSCWIADCFEEPVARLMA